MKQVKVGVYALGRFALLAANVASAQGPPKAGPEQQRLKYFVGQWKHEGEVKPGPFGPGGKFTSTEDSHMLGDFYLASHSKGSGPMGTMEEVATIGYDPKLKAYTYDEFSSLGMHDHATGNPSGKVWTWTSDEDIDGKKMKGKFVLTEVSANQYTYKFEGSMDDGKTWSSFVEGKATKVSKAQAKTQ